MAVDESPASSGCEIRSVLTCISPGVASACCATGVISRARPSPPTSARPMGIIAAQSIGEPGTQLTMRTFHIGGAASKSVPSRARWRPATEGKLKFINLSKTVSEVRRRRWW